MLPHEFVIRWNEQNGMAGSDWGSDTLVLFNPKNVEALQIPAASKSFMIEAGLPAKTMVSILFDLPPNTLPRLPEALTGQVSLPESYNRYRLLGKYTETYRGTEIAFYYYCIDEAENGEIVVVDPQENWSARFLNSSIQQLAQFLLLFRQSYIWTLQNGFTGPKERTMSWDEGLEQGQHMLALFREVDPKACEEGMGWADYLVGMAFNT
jgi:hypothetical protein